MIHWAWLILAFLLGEFIGFLILGFCAINRDEERCITKGCNVCNGDDEHDGSTSDGYHTFDELYHHRAILFSVIVRNYSALCWKSKLHHDGTMYDEMFIVGIDTPEGQASYHYNLSPYWDMFDCVELERAPEWDGHTPSQAIERIGKLTSQIRYGRWKNGDGIYDTCTSCGQEIYQAIAMLYCPLCGARMDENDNACAAATQRPPDNYVGEAAVEYGAPFDEPL